MGSKGHSGEIGTDRSPDLTATLASVVDRKVLVFLVYVEQKRMRRMRSSRMSSTISGQLFVLYKAMSRKGWSSL